MSDLILYDELSSLEGLSVFNMSGGSTKIPGILGAADYVFNTHGYRPDLITGISAGALLAIPIALRKWGALKTMSTTFTLDDIFDRKPVDENNKITRSAKIRAIMGKSSFGTQNNLYKTISKIVTEEDFSRYQKGNYPHCIISTVDFKTGSRLVVNLKSPNITYEQYLLYVNASCSLPFAVEPVKYDNMILYDGGTRNHILSGWVLHMFDNVKSSVSIFSRPEDCSNILDVDWNDDNLMAVFERLLDINSIEISKRDEIYEKYMVKEKGVEYFKQIFIPSVIKELYDTNKSKLKILYNLGHNSAMNKLKNIKPGL